jgi:hypothetical protein
MTAEQWTPATALAEPKILTFHALQKQPEAP